MLTLPHMGINDIIEPVQVGGSERTNGHSLTHPLTHSLLAAAGWRRSLEFAGFGGFDDVVLEVLMFWRFAVF